MSGPKVFHVVTREELVARCEAHLRQLDAAIAEWTKACKRKGAADAHDTEAVASRRDALRRMLKDGRFSELQKQVPAELSFLRADAQARIERAAAAAAQVMQNRRRTAHTARTLLEALGKSGRRVPEDLRRALESTESIANTEAAIARAFALLAPVAASGVATGRQRELASKLGRDEKRATLAEWLASQPSLAEGGSYLQIDRHLAELSALDVDPSPFTARAAAIAGELPPRQALLADSLLVDLADAVKEARERSARLRGLGERAAELAHHGSAVAQALRSRIEVAIAAKDASSAPALIAEADALVQEELRGARSGRTSPRGPPRPRKPGLRGQRGHGDRLGTRRPSGAAEGRHPGLRSRARWWNEIRAAPGPGGRVRKRPDPAQRLTRSRCGSGLVLGVRTASDVVIEVGWRNRNRTCASGRSDASQTDRGSEKARRDRRRQDSKDHAR